MTNTSAAQWCVWRIRLPAGTSKTMSITERYCSPIVRPTSGA